MKKRLLSVVLAGILAVAAATASAFFVYADEPLPSEGLTYTEDESGEGWAVQIGESCTDTEIVIPAVYGEKPVVAIAEYGFWGQPITKITIPEGIRCIGMMAFSGCESLTEVTLPASLEFLGESAFANCTNLAKVTFLSEHTNVMTNAIPEGVTVETAHHPAVGMDGFRTAPGKTFDLPITLTANPGFNYAKLYLTYDTSVFTLTGVDVADAFASMNFEKSTSLAASPVVLVFAAAADAEASGTLCTLHFTVQNTAADATEEISLTVVECLNDEDTPVTLDARAAKITVKHYTPGDITEDGSISGTDLTHLLQHLAGWKIDLYSGAADVNVDGAIDGKDATLLLQYLAEWDVTLGVAQPEAE